MPWHEGYTEADYNADMAATRTATERDVTRQSSAEITTLKGQVQTLEGQVATATQEKETLTQQVTQLTSERDTAQRNDAATMALLNNGANPARLQALRALLPGDADLSDADKAKTAVEGLKGTIPELFGTGGQQGGTPPPHSNGSPGSPNEQQGLVHVKDMPKADFRDMQRRVMAGEEITFPAES